MQTKQAGRTRRSPVAPAGRAVRHGSSAARRRLVTALGGPFHTRVVVVLACVLALSSADTATVGSSAIELRHALRISNTDIGLLVSVTALVAAVFSVPFGALADRLRRTWVLAFTIALWGVAMIWSASVSTFGDLMFARLLLGAVMAAAGPMVASLVGDWIPGPERGKVYSYILTGDLAGAGVGFAVTGDLAALSWRAAFVFLAIPSFVLAWALFRTPEPARGGRGVLLPEPGYAPPGGHHAAPPGTAGPDGTAGPGRTMGASAPAGPGRAGAGASSGANGTWAPDGAMGAAGAAAEEAMGAQEPGTEGPTDAQRLAYERGIQPDMRLVRRARPRMRFGAAVGYVLAVRTNIALIVASACGYYFLAGVETFGVEFVKGQYGISQVLSGLLLLVVGAGAIIGILVGGRAGDFLLHRGHLSGRVTVSAVTATATVVLFIPALLTHNVLMALPYVMFAAAALEAQNPPISAARLDIMPSWLWGRAEGVRTFLQTGAQALAPVAFGVFSDDMFGGGTAGLRWTFAVMLVPLAASAVFMFWAVRRYPRDVATAGAATSRATLRTSLIG